VLHPRLSVFVDARNLADKAYVSNAQAAIAAQPATAAYWPGDSRSVYAGVTAAF
jgi:iron complex outermembrane receptor protein